MDKHPSNQLVVAYILLAAFFELSAIYHWWYRSDFQATVLDLLWWIGISLTFLLAFVADWIGRHP